MRKIVLTFAVAMTMVMMIAGSALAAGPHHGTDSTTVGDRTLLNDATVTHATYLKFTKYYPTGKVDSYGGESLQCDACHAGAEKHMSGPHGGYTNSTNRCVACHTVHKASNAQLLPGTTVTDTCNFCHDLTGTEYGPYNATGIQATDIKSAHRVADFTYDGVSWTNYVDIPGGNSTTGGVATFVYTSDGLSAGKFTCDSCHTPHGGATVNAYIGESAEKVSSFGLTGGDEKIYKTNRLLKAKPDGVASAVTNYGSAWCIACHKGRDNMGSVFNHPVNESGLAYSYQQIATKDATYLYVDADVSGEVYADTNTDPRTNKNYMMNTLGDAYDPLANANVRQDGSLVYGDYDGGVGPACQQCHASPRKVEDAFGKGAGTGAPDRYTFPHMSTTPSLLIQQGDDFCTNCHQVNDLP